MAIAFDPYASYYERKARESRGGPKASSEEIYEMYQGATAGKYNTETSRRSQAATERYQQGSLDLQREQMEQQQAQQKLGMLVNAPLYLASVERMTKGADGAGWVSKGWDAASKYGKDLYNTYWGSASAANSGAGATAMEAGLESAYGGGQSSIYGMGEYGEAAYNAPEWASSGAGADAMEAAWASAYGDTATTAGADAYAASVGMETTGGGFSAASGMSSGTALGALALLEAGASAAGYKQYGPITATTTELKKAGDWIEENVTDPTGRWLDDNVFQPVKETVGTVICTELARQGRVPWELIHFEHRYHNFDAATYAGYRAWADPYVRLMQRSRLATRLVSPFASAFLREVASRVEPSRSGSWLGKLIIKVGVPLCRLLGTLKGTEVCYG